MASLWAAFEWGAREWASSEGVVPPVVDNRGGGLMSVEPMRRRKRLGDDDLVLDLIMAGVI